MRPNGHLTAVLAVVLALLGGAALGQPSAPEQARPAMSTTEIQALAEQVFEATLADRLAAVITAESAEFADRMAALYLSAGSGPDWRAEVAQIHNAARVSGLLQAALQVRLAENPVAAQRLRALLGATGVAAGTDGQGLQLAARMQLTKPERLAATARRLSADFGRGTAELSAITRMIGQGDPVTDRLAARMNREIAFARGYAQGGGFDFPTASEDVAADLWLQEPELTAEITARSELALYAAFAPLGAAAIDRIAAARAMPRARALAAILALAEGDVLDQLAAESGRAAARRHEGSPL
ncbi:hypothetical protein [Paracoccus xiamenensis]|uniref:hypothetical protein n=1 Tax=Paracoccus xiamenensis TaxID=2714901 RepID=UPI00140A7001|nr:hypothetical protein [Paracoccus xiamenensis]NHF72054.1 hypothetical protein [Paracoccus xiamenensis]